MYIHTSHQYSPMKDFAALQSVAAQIRPFKTGLGGPSAVAMCKGRLVGTSEG